MRAQFRCVQVRYSIEAEQSQLRSAQAHDRVGGVVQHAIQPQNAAVGNVERHSRPDSYWRCLGEDNHITGGGFAAIHALAAASDASTKAAPTLARIWMPARNPGIHERSVARQPPAMDAQILATRGAYFLAHRFILSAEFGIFCAQHRSELAIDIVQVELVPAYFNFNIGKPVLQSDASGAHFRGGFALPMRGPGICVREADSLRGEIFTQQPGLLSSKLGKRVVGIAGPCLSVAHEIDVAQPCFSSREAASRIRPCTRWSKSRKRQSEVCPR